MKVKDLIVENKIDEAPMGALKSFGLTSLSKVSPTASGKLQTGTLANQLSADFKEYLGKTGLKAEPDVVLDFLRSKGMPTDAAEKIIAAGPEKSMLAKGMDAIKGMVKGKGTGAQQPQDAGGQQQQPSQQKKQPAGDNPQPQNRVEPKLDPETPQQQDPAQKPNFNNQLGGGQQKISTGGTNDPSTFKNVPGTQQVPTGVPSTTDPRTAFAKPAQGAEQPETPAGRKQGGGKVAGQLSQTPGAVKKRDARAAAKSGSTNNAISQFVKTQTGDNPIKMNPEPQQNPVPQKQKQPRQRKKPGAPGGKVESISRFSESVEYEFDLLLEALSRGQLDKIFMAVAQDSAKAGVQGGGGQQQAGGQQGGGQQAGGAQSGGQQGGQKAGGAAGGFIRGLMGQDDSEGPGGIKGNLNVNQLAAMLPGVDPKVLTQAISVIRQGRQPNRNQITTLGNAMIAIIKADPQTTQQIMMQLKKVQAK
jgi:hypothetical protein